MEYVAGSLISLFSFLLGFYLSWRMTPYLPSMARVFPTSGPKEIVVSAPPDDNEVEMEDSDENNFDLDRWLHNIHDVEQEEHDYEMLRKYRNKSRNRDGWLHL